MIPTSAKGFLSPQAYGLRNHICMIPCGGLLGDANQYWTKDQLLPYAKYVVNNQIIDNMFKGFIFNGIRAREKHFIYPLFVGFGDPSDITDWLLWADALFLPNLNLNALADVAGNEKRDVWVSIPYPHPFQKSFGTVGGRVLNFLLEDDRLEAVKWWIDQFLVRWNKNAHLHQNLDFRGFLWQREAIDANDEPLAARVNEWIHKKGCLSMWLPNYGSFGVMNWKKMGFDVTAVNTNYTGNTSYDYKWIQYSSLFSATYHTGMQMIWGKGLIYSDNHHLDYWNLGLPAHCGFMTESYLVYQFPNQRLDVLMKSNLVDYVRLYTFIKGLYQRVEYPGIPYN